MKTRGYVGPFLKEMGGGGWSGGGSYSIILYRPKGRKNIVQDCNPVDFSQKRELRCREFCNFACRNIDLLA